MADISYDLYIKKLKDKYTAKNATEDLGLNDVDIDAYANKEADKLTSYSATKRNEQANTTSGNVNSNQIEWANEYEEESLNWWERMGAWINSVKDTVTQSFLKLGEGLIDFGASTIGNLGTDEFKQEMADFVKKDLTGDFMGTDFYRVGSALGTGTWMFGLDEATKFAYNDEATADWVKNIAQGVGSSLGFAAMTAVPVVGWGLAYGASSGMGVEEALNDGATPEKAYLYGLGSGTVEILTEKFVGRLLNAVGKGGAKVANKLLGTKFSGNIANNVVAGIGKGTGSSIFLNLVKNFNEEGMEEVVSDVMNPILKMIYKECDEDNFFSQYGKFFNENGGWEGLLESYFYGGASAALMGGVQTGARIGKYRSVKAVQFENSIQNVIELNEELQKELEKNDINQYPNPADNPKIAKLLQQKEWLREKIGDDFKDWLDTVKTEYDEATKDEPIKTKKGYYVNNKGELLTDSQVRNLELSSVREGLRQVGENSLNAGIEDLQHNLGANTYEKGANYKYVGTDNINKTNLSKKIVYVNGKQSFKQYMQSVLHENEHIASEGLGNNTLTDEIISGMSKEEYNKEFEKQAVLEGDNYLKKNSDGKKFLESKGLTYDKYETLSDDKKIELKVEAAKANPGWFNEEVAAEHLIDYFANFEEFNRVIDGVSAKGIKKILNSVRRAFTNTSNKPANYDKVINALQEGLKAERNRKAEITEENVKNKKIEKKFGNFENTLQKSKKDAIIKSKEVDENDFRRIQEESRGVTKEEQQLFWSGDKSLDEGTRKVLRDVFKRWLGARSLEWSDGKQLDLVSKKTDTNFKFYQEVDANTFHDIFEITRKYLRYGELVDLHDVKTSEEHGIGYEDTTNYLSEDGMQGFAITKDGDLISVFNLDTQKRGFLYAISDFVKQNVKTLDCFVSPHQNLMLIYEKTFGFKPASIMDFNMEYNRDDIAKNHNKPQVAFMVNNSNVETRTFDKNSYDEAKKWQLENIDATQNDKIRYRITEDSNGNELTEQQQEYFKNSKVVDSKGRLKVVYHGTKEDFTIFDYVSQNNNTGGYNVGHWFTDNENFAYTISVRGQGDIEKSKVIKTYLNIENPVIKGQRNITEEQRKTIFTNLLERMDRSYVDKFLDYVFDDHNGSIYYFASQINKDASYKNLDDYSFIMELFSCMDKNTSYVFRNILKESGYDGLVYLNKKDTGWNEGNVYVAFDSNQIKAVDNLNPTEESDDIRYRITEENQDFEEVINAKNYTENENTQHDLFSRNNDDFLMIQNKLTQFDTEQYDDDLDDEGIDVQDILKDIKKYIQKTINEYYKPLKEELAKSNYDAQKIVDLNYNYTNRIRDLLENYDDWMEVAEDQADDKWLEDIDNKLNKVISDFPKIRDNVNKLNIKNKPKLIRTANPELLYELNDNLERYNNVDEEYKNRREVLEAKLSKAKVNIKKFRNAAIQLEKPIKRVLDNVKVDKPFAKESTKTKYYNEVVAPFDTLIEQYKITLRDVKISDEDIKTAVNYLINDMLGGRHYRNARLKKIDFIREQYENLTLSPQEIVENVRESQPIQNTPEVRTRFINNSRKVATPDMAGIKAQADLRKDGKVYTLNSVMNLTKTVESTLRNEPVLSDKNVTIDYEGSTRELKSLEIAMVLNEYNNSQYVKEESKQINYSNLTNEQKIEKISGIITGGITMTINGETVRLSTLVEANDALGTIVEEYIRAQVENLVNNEGNVSKITKVLEKQEKAFNERLNAVKQRNRALSNQIIDLNRKVEEEKQKGKDRNKKLIKEYNDKIKELKKQSNKEINELRKELRKTAHKIDVLEEKAQRKEALVRKYQRRNMELYTDNNGVKKIKYDDILMLNDLGKQINPDFKMSAYVENQIVNYLSKGQFDKAVDLYMNAILNSDYVDGDEVKPYSYFIGDYSYGDDLILEDGATFENDIMELRKEMIEIFKGSEVSTRQKLIDKISNMATYNHYLKMKLRDTKMSYVAYRHAYRASNTAKRVYKKVIDIDKNGGSKSGNRLAGTSPKWVKAILDFVQGNKNAIPLNKMTPEAIIRGEHKESLRKLLEAYEELEANKEVVYPMDDSLKAYINYLLNDEVQVNGKYVDIYKRVLNGINRLIENEIGERKIKFGNIEGVISDVSRRMQEENTLKDGEKEETFRFTQSFLTPFAVVDKLAKYQEQAVIRQIYEELFNAEMKKEEADIKLREPFIDFRNKNKKVVKSFFKSLGKEVEIKYGDGKTITANKSKLFSFYEAFKREQARGHIENPLGGIEIGNKMYNFDTKRTLELKKLIGEEKAKGKNADTNLLKKYKSEIQEIIMTEVKSLVNAIEKEFNLDNSKSVNSQYLKTVEKFFEIARELKKEVDIERLGFSNVEDGFYFPIRIADGDAQASISSEDYFKTNMPGAANYSWNKNTTGTMGAIKLLDIEDIIERHSNQMATYVGYGVVTDNIRKIWNYKLEGGKNVRKTILSRFVDGDGAKVERWFATLVNDVQGIGKGSSSNVDTLFKKVVNRLRGNVAKVALGFNPKVMLAQTASIPAAMRYVRGKYLLQAFTMKLSNVPPKPAMLLYRENHELVGQAETQGAIDKIGSIFTKGINFFDKIAIDNIWKACLLQTKNADGSWNVDAATKLAQKTVFDTQPNYLQLGRSEFLRSSNDFVKLFTMFQSQAQQNLSMAYDSINKLIYKKRHKMPITKDDWSELGHALTALLIQALVYTGMGELFSHIVKNDWGDKSFGENVGDYGISIINDNIIGMIPLINNVEIDLEKEWKVNIEKLGSGFIDNYIDIINNFEGFENMSVQDWNTALSYTFGVPGTNIYKWTKAFGQYLPNAEDYFDELDINYRGLDLKKGNVTSATKAGNRALERKYYKQFSKKNGLDITTANKLYKLYSKSENEKDVYSKVIISAIPEKYTKDGEEIEIDKNEFLKTYSKLSSGLNSVMNSTSYSKYSEEQQAKILTKTISIYYSASRKSITGDNMNLLETLAFNGKTIDADTIYAILEASEIEADKKNTRKANITKYINKLKISKANKYFIYATLGYSVDSKLYKAYLVNNLKLTSYQVKKMFAK